MEVVYATFSDFNFAAIFIYAPAKQDQNHEFWQEFILYVNSISFLYIIIGDFNEIGSSQDKMGGVSVLLLQELLSCLTYLRKLIV